MGTEFIKEEKKEAHTVKFHVGISSLAMKTSDWVMLPILLIMVNSSCLWNCPSFSVKTIALIMVTVWSLLLGNSDFHVLSISVHL